MPQVDKSASTYSPPVQYVPPISSPAASQQPASTLPRTDINKFSVVSGDILKSCDWSAVIHRPAEDSEPEDLPSTVDMDAIKEPSTPLPPPLTPGPSNSQEQASDSDDDSSGSDSEGDSSSDTNSDSQDGSESGSCSWSDSNSTGSSNKRRSSFSSRSHSPQPTFSIRETNFEQGGLKLKLSATKPKTKIREESSSSSDAYDSSSSEEEEIVGVEKQEKVGAPTLRKRGGVVPLPVPVPEEPLAADTNKSEPPTPTKPATEQRIRTRAKTIAEDKPKNEPKTKDTVKTAEPPPQAAKVKSKTEPPPAKKSSSRLSSLRRRRQEGTAVAKLQQPSGGRRTRLRAAALKKTQIAETKVPANKVVGGGVKPSAGSEGASTTEDDNEDEDEGGGDEIAQLAHQLRSAPPPAAAAPEPAIPISDQLQEINQEDLAAILPDVGGGGSFDGFEDVSCGAGGRRNGGSAAGGNSTVTNVGNAGGTAAGTSGGVVSSGSSDVELLPEQDQIVTEAINRISQLDSEEGNTRQTRRSNLVASVAASSTNNLSSSDDEESEREEVGYSSNLLEQFVEKTEMLSRGEVSVNIGSNDMSTSGTSEQPSERQKAEQQQPKRRGRGRPPKQQQQQQQQDLEAFMRLDCSQSNVSPDSGIQSVAGSPSHPSCSPAPHSPQSSTLHQPAPTQQSQLPEQQPAQTQPNRIRARNVDPVLYPPRRKQTMQQRLHKAANKFSNTGNSKLSNLHTTNTIESCIENGGKRGPGRPKGSTRKRKGQRGLVRGVRAGSKGGERRVLPVLPPSAAELRVPPYFAHKCPPTIPNLPPGISKRGPGRPKKTPPTLEPILPLEKVVNRTKGVSSSVGKDSLVKSRCSRLRSAIPQRNVCLPKGLRSRGHHHRHKRRRHRHSASREFQMDPKFLAELETLAIDFERTCTITRRGDVQRGGTASGVGAAVSTLPHAFRVKRAPKKKKVVSTVATEEKVQPPVLESGTSTAIAPDCGTAAPALTPSNTSIQAAAPPTTSSTTTVHHHKDKSSAIAIVPPQNTAPQQPTATAKRRIKKSTVEVPKNRDKPEANNEQRLPLKKRHYHMSGAQSQGGGGGGSGGGEQTERGHDTSLHHVKSAAANLPADKVLEKSSKCSHPSGKNLAQITGGGVAGGKPSTLRMSETRRIDHPRNSVDDSIDASVNKCTNESVIVTPKKRHRLEMEKRSINGIKNSGGGKEAVKVLVPTKRVVSRLSSQSGRRDRSASPQAAAKKVRKCDLESPKNHASPKSSTASPHLPKRTHRYSAIEEIVEDSEVECIEDKKSKYSTPLVIDKKPPAGVFEPSSKTPTDPLADIIKIPEPPANRLTSAPVLSKIKDKLNPIENLSIDIGDNLKGLRFKRAAEDLVERLEPKDKRRKVICDLRVHVTKLPTNTILKKVMNSIKMKVRRKKMFNRTGFPVKKKKKKAKFVGTEKVHTLDCNPSPPPVLEDQTKLPPVVVGSMADESSPALSPVTKVESKTEEDEALPLSDREIKMEKTVIKTELKVECSSAEPTNVPRPGSRRLMELRAKTVASERRKRKTDNVEPTIFQEQCSDPPTPIIQLQDPKNFAVAKRFRKTKEGSYDSDADSMKLRKKNPPRWRKKYLPAGLFSDYYKEDEPRKSSDPSKYRSMYIACEHKFGLLPPPTYCARWVRQRKLHFQLPHDLWWLHVNNRLPGRDTVPSWNYKKIRTNVYFDVKPTYVSCETQACNCSSDGDVGCGEDCINRMVFSECSPQLCPCRDKCSNQKIQRHEWAPGLAKFMTKDKGWGVKTKHHIKNGEFILEYVGEVVSEREFKSRMASRYQYDTHHYCLNLDGGLVIDGHRMGGDGRFVNHSCEPNCEMQKWSVNGLFRMALFALRDITSNEELTYDYNFSLFNPAEGQPCKCGSTKCRGVIGGKSQRVPLFNSLKTSVNTEEKGIVGNGGGSVGAQGNCRSNGRLRKNSRKTNSVEKKVNGKIPPKDVKLPVKDATNAHTLASVAARLNHLTPIRPLSNQQKAFIAERKCFLLRNFEKVKQLRERLKLAVRGGQLAMSDGVGSSAACGNSLGNSGSNSSSNGGVSGNGGGFGSSSGSIVSTPNGSSAHQADVFMTQLNALSCPRSIRTRRLALAQDNPEMTKTAKLACIFKHLYSEVSTAKDESGDVLSAAFVTLPSRRKFPLYYQRITRPIDLASIEQNIITGVYRTVESFDEDMTLLFKNNVRWYGRTSELGIAATRLRKVYNIAKLDCIERLKETLGEDPPASFLPHHEDPGGEEEDVIRCICGLYKDEGLMIQCERCLVWQHCDCVRADTTAERYLCERCSPRPVDLEIPMQEQPDYATPGQKHFITLLRGSLQLKQGDTVYVLRDIVNEESTTVPKGKHNYLTIKDWKYSDCDIFRIERLWKDEKGDRFAFGHHFLRPHETYHEPTRKFFSNEVMRVPLYEVVPLELIMGHCYVLDVNTFCKGRPVGAEPHHVYICEYRVDRAARLFAKLARPKHSTICTKSYAFEMYDTRLKPQRTYAPHGTPKSGGNGISRGRGGRSAAHHTDNDQRHTVTQSAQQQSDQNSKPISPKAKRQEQKVRLNRILLRLLSRLPSKQPLDLSYLLEGGRRQRKKPPLLSS